LCLCHISFFLRSWVSGWNPLLAHCDEWVASRKSLSRFEQMSYLPSTSPVALDAGATEIKRIRDEYARRKREVPGGYYSWHRKENYFHHAGLVRDTIVELTREKLFPLENKRLADIGCGTGRWLLEFAQWDASELYGIDLDESQIELAKKRFPGADLHA